MDNIYEKLVDELRFKFRKIINLYEVEKNKNFELESQIQKLENQYSELKKSKEELELKLNSLSIAKKLTGTDVDAHNAKLKVNKMVREIDKCIALLNK